MYVRMDLRPSLLLRTARAALHAACLASLFWVELHAGMRIAIGLLIAGSFLHVTNNASRQPRAILFIDGVPRLLFQDHALEVELLEYVYCTSLLQVLCFSRSQISRFPDREDKQSISWFCYRNFYRNFEYCVVILPDTSRARDRRRLRTLLRWQGQVVIEGGSGPGDAQPRV